MNKYRRYFSLILIFCLLCNCCRSYAYEVDNNFTTIVIGTYDSDKKEFLVSLYSVIEEQGDFWFSEQDIVQLTGYNVSKKDNKIVFTRGFKAIQINIKDETLNVGSNISLIKSPNIIITDNNILYFSGSQLLPWLNVNCYEEEGILYIFPDVISLWDFIDKFNQTKESFLFDFRFCCQQLGVQSKWLEAASFICDNGAGMLKYVKIPFLPFSYGEYEKYYDIFEEMLEEPNHLWNLYKSIFDLGLMTYDINQLMDEIEGNYVNKFDTHRTLENMFDYLNYFHIIVQNNEEKLMWINTVLGNRENYPYPEAMISAAFDIKDSYSSILDGILIKVRHMFVDWGIDKIIDGYTGDGIFKGILDGIGLYQDYAIDWIADIDNIKYYNAIASAGIAVSSEYYASKQSDIYAIKLLRAHTALYLYATEKNWEIMAEYAGHKRKIQLKKEYLDKASLASEWLVKFMMSSDSTTNDSFQYGEGRMKEEYTDELKSLFSMIQTDVEEAPISDTEIFLSFLNSETDAMFDTNFQDSLSYVCKVYNFESGETTCTFDTAKMISYEQLVGAIENSDYIFSEPPKMEKYYAIINTVSGKEMLAIKFQNMDIYCQGDDSYALFLLTVDNEQLYITYAYDSWDRSHVDIYDNLIFEGIGSSGAGVTYIWCDYIDETSHYKLVYDMTLLYDDWVAMYDWKTFDMDTEWSRGCNVTILTTSEKSYYWYEAADSVDPEKLAIFINNLEESGKTQIDNVDAMLNDAYKTNNISIENLALFDDWIQRD